jgi:hypothetical protein
MDINLGFQFKEKSNGYGKLSALQLSPSVVNGKAHTAIEKETYKRKTSNEKSRDHQVCTPCLHFGIDRHHRPIDSLPTLCCDSASREGDSCGNRPSGSQEENKDEHHNAGQGKSRTIEICHDDHRLKSNYAFRKE